MEMSNCTCDWPSVEYNTISEHSIHCPTHRALLDSSQTTWGEKNTVTLDYNNKHAMREIAIQRRETCGL